MSSVHSNTSGGWASGLALGLIFLLSFAPAALAAPGSTAKTKDLIRVLQSSAGFFEKARACQQLGEVGTPEAVPVLADLLADPKLSAYARSGLEGISDASAAAALRDAAQKLHGSLLAGVINSLGVLKDPRAEELLYKLAGDPSSGVAGEALLALGNIGTADAIRFLRRNLTTQPEAYRGDVAAACLLAADQLRARGDLKAATDLYDWIRAAPVPAAYRVGATRGAILARTTDRVPFLIGQLRSEEPVVRNAALLTIREIPDDPLANALNEEVSHAAREFQPQLLLALADCHNPQSLKVVQSLVNNSDPEVRRTALLVLCRLGVDAAPALLGALPNASGDERTIVLSGLKGFEGSGVDDLLIKALAAENLDTVKIDLVRILDSRGAVTAAPELMKLAAGPAKELSIAALSALRSLAGVPELPSLITLVKSTHDPETREAAENAVVGVCGRAGETACGTVLTELELATGNTNRNSWVRVLARVGYPKALPRIDSAARDSDSESAINAITELGHWPNPAPMETLLTIAEAGGTPARGKPAIAAALDLANTASDETQVPEPTIVNWLQRLAKATDSADDQRRILGLLGHLKTPESFHMLVGYLERPELRMEAAVGIFQMAPALGKTDRSAEVRAALDKIASTANNVEVQNRARQLAKTLAEGPAVKRIFDGESLAGWEGDTNVWRVRDGVIVGGSLKGNPRNEFLATTRTYTNFVLQLEYRLVGTEGFVNSGVQFRSVRMSNPSNEMNGYQADIGAGYSGCLYDESRRNTFLARASENAVQRLELTNDWNRYEIRCEGPHIQLWLNGEKTVDYVETDGALPQRGLIGLQIHGGNKAEVSFRNIVIQEQ